MTDLLNKLNAQATSGEGKSSAPKSPTAHLQTGETLIGNGGNQEGLSAGDSLIDDVVETPAPKARKAPVQPKVETVQREDNPDVVKTFSEPETWTKDSAMLEVKKLREENKALRLRERESIEQVKTSFESRMAALEEKHKDAVEAKKKLEALEAEKEDKKRSIEEKVAHREARIAELELQMKHLESNYQDKIGNITTKLTSYEVEREAQLQVYRERINEEIKNVPEKFKKIAEVLVKGIDDPREAWTTLSEAKMSGLFEDRQVVVSHAVPGASDGARTTSEKLENARKDQLSKMSGQQKIRAGLDNLKSRRGSII